MSTIDDLNVSLNKFNRYTFFKQTMQIYASENFSIDFGMFNAN